MEGTNCEDEAFRAFLSTGFIPEYVHINELDRGTKKLENYSAIFIPGGFSGGDYIRAGALFSARLRRHFHSILKFVDSRKPVVGVCNGFQVLAELGILPDSGGNQEREIALSINQSGRFECRDTYLRIERDQKLLQSKFRKGDVALSTVAHSEGRVVFRDQDIMDDIERKGLAILRYTDGTGKSAGYPWNPNGSAEDIAGVMNPEGNVIGLMPHPERKLMAGAPNVGRVFGLDFFLAINNYLKNS